MLILQNLPMGYEAVWFDFDQTTELYGSTDNLFQPIVSQNTTYYGAIRELASGCLSELLAVQVMIEIVPQCIPPAPVMTNCVAFDPNLSIYGTAMLENGVCLDSVAQSANYNQFDTVCDHGTLIRNFTAYDCDGNTSVCSQTIVVTYEQNYFVKFPDDMILAACDETGFYGEPSFLAQGCELLGINYVDQVFPDDPDTTYIRIERNWTIINYCTYNPNLPCIIIPNPNPSPVSDDPSNLPGPTVSACGAPAPWAPTVTKINPDDPAPTNYCSFFDVNANCYQYKQIIRVMDQQAPVLVCPADVSITNNEGLCTAEFNYTPPVGTDNCSGATTIQTAGLSPNTPFPIGTTTNSFQVTDASGNTATCAFTVTVLTPEANALGNGNGIDDGDVTPDTDDDTQYGTLNVGDNLVHTFSIENLGTSSLYIPEDGITLSGPDANQFSTGDISLPKAIAPGGSATFTVTYTPISAGTHTATVNIANNDCDEAPYDFAVEGNAVLSGGTTVSGKIVFENDDVTGVKDVSVNLSGAATATTLTDINGDYSMTVNTNGNFTIQGVKHINRLNGVTTADVSRIQQHVIGNFPFSDPYKLFAADINHNNQVSTQDVTLLQQAILGNPAALAVFNVFWRFTAVPLNMPPWPQLPAAEQINLSGAIGNVPNQNFTGTKIGDVTTPSANPATGPSIISPLLWNVQDQTLIAGEEITVTFRAAHFEDLAAYQFGLGFDPERMQLIGWQSTGNSGLPVNADNFGFYESESGKIRSAWAQAGPATLATETPVFALKFKVLESGGKLNGALWVDSETMPAVAYTPDFQPQEVLLEFVEDVTGTNNVPKVDGLQLLQNRPNPFNGETVIEFLMPQAGEARLRVFDGNGRLLAESVCDCAAGYHAQRFDLSGALPGMLYYELTTPFGVRAKKMMRF